VLKVGALGGIRDGKKAGDRFGGLQEEKVLPNSRREDANLVSCLGVREGEADNNEGFKQRRPN